MITRLSHWQDARVGDFGVIVMESPDVTDVLSAPPGYSAFEPKQVSIAGLHTILRVVAYSLVTSSIVYQNVTAYSMKFGQFQVPIYYFRL